MHRITIRQVLAATLLLGSAMGGPVPARAASTSVTISDYTFSPDTITIHPGDAITWTNADSVPHTATAVDGKSFDTHAIDPGATSTQVRFATPGTYAYHCAIHPSMRGMVVVK